MDKKTPQRFVWDWESRKAQRGDERTRRLCTQLSCRDGAGSWQHWLSSWAMVLWATAATRTLSDPFPTGVLLRIPEDHKTIQGNTCCTALVLIMFCLTAVLTPETVHFVSALLFSGHRKTISFRQILFTLTSFMKTISKMSAKLFFLGTFSKNLLSPFAL